MGTFSWAIRYVAKQAFSSCNMLTYVCNMHSQFIIIMKAHREGPTPESWNGSL